MTPVEAWRRWWRRGPMTIRGDAYIGDATVYGPVQVDGNATFDRSRFEIETNGGTALLKSGGGMLLKNCNFVHSGTVALNGGSKPGFPFPIVAPETNSPPDLELTFAVEPIVAWRAWRLVDFEFRGGSTEHRLAPFSASLPWEPRRRVEAICTANGHHEAPWQTCTCGIWAVRDAERAENVGGDLVGSVYLWGRVLEFEEGYRAQYAYPKELVAPDRESANALTRIYGVPVGARAE